MQHSPVVVAIALIIAGACSEPVAPDAAARNPGTTNTITVSDSYIQNAPLALSNGNAAPQQNGSCTFSRGTTTCVTSSQHQETSTHQEVSGCSYGPFFPPQPGRHVRTFEDTFLVTQTTTTYYHGRSNNAYKTETTTSRQLTSSTLTSDVCEAL